MRGQEERTSLYRDVDLAIAFRVLERVCTVAIIDVRTIEDYDKRVRALRPV